MTVTIEESLSSGFIAMEPLYERLLNQKFVTSEEAIEYCHKSCLEYGFTVKHEINANRNICIYCCSRGKRQCQWKIILNQDEFNMWKFRKSNITEHNHEIIKEEEEEWPTEVVQKIIQLSRQKEKDEIREIIKLQFPQITWNDRRFLNYFFEERKRQKQKEITERVQKLILSSTKLCSVVAANEDWASCVEADLMKMLSNYRQRTRVSNQALDNMVDLQLDMIHSEIDNKSTTSGSRKVSSNSNSNNNTSNKKRKSLSSNHHHHVAVDSGVQIMSIPSCTLFIRSQPLRSLSEPSNNNNGRRALNDMISSSTTSTNQQQQQQQQQLNASFGVNSVFNLSSPISSPSSTSSIQQRIDYGNGFRGNEMLQSPPIPDSNMMISPNYNQNNGGGGNNTYSHNMYSFSPYQQQQQSSSTTTSTSAYNGGSGGGGGGGGGNNNEFNFEPSSYGGQITSTPSPAPILIHGNRHGNGMYFNSNSHIGRDSGGGGGSGSGIQQRMMMQQQQQQQQQEYDSRHFMDTNHHNVHLPTIRSVNNMHPLVQQQHHHGHMNPNQPQQNWS